MTLREEENLFCTSGLLTSGRFQTEVCLYTYMSVLIYRSQEGLEPWVTSLVGVESQWPRLPLRFFTIPMMNRFLFLLGYLGGVCAPENRRSLREFGSRHAGKRPRDPEMLDRGRSAVLLVRQDFERSVTPGCLNRTCAWEVQDVDLRWQDQRG